MSDYLGNAGLDEKRIDVAGRGEREPLTQGQCRGLSGPALIGCLQADRRVEIEVRARDPGA